MYSGKQALRLEKFKASDIGGLDKELKERKGSGKYDSNRTPYNIELINYDGPTLASSTYDYLYSIVFLIVYNHFLIHLNYILSLFE